MEEVFDCQSDVHRAFMQKETFDGFDVEFLIRSCSLDMCDGNATSWSENVDCFSVSEGIITETTENGFMPQFQHETARFEEKSNFTLFFSL